MQLSHTQPVWYFVFGGQAKSSLAAQYSLEHGLQHLVNPSETTLHQHERKALFIEGSVELFRSVEKWKGELVAVFLKGQLNEQEEGLRRDYELIGKARVVTQPTYFAFRKELYPQLMIVYGPDDILITSLIRDYFAYTAFRHLPNPITANQLLALPKTQNYVLTGFTPDPAELSVLENHLHLQIVHLRHNRTELPQREQWFDHQASITPIIEKKPYYRAVSGYIHDIIEQVGTSFLPELIYANVHEKEEREIVRKYVESTDGLLLNVLEMQQVLRRKPNKGEAESDKISLLIKVLFQNIKRTEVVLTDFPWSPQQFVLLQTHTRRFRQFADFVRADHYQFSKAFNAPIYFLQTLRRKQIDPELPFESQVKKTTKYLLVSGAPCAGKTSAAKFIAGELGYRHIEYEPYLASVKEKLIAPEDGEELPFRKVIAHFAGLVAASGNTPILIDGLPLDPKEVENWTKSVGPATVLNLKVEERELIRRTRKKAEADLAAEVGEQQLAKVREAVSKNVEWTDSFTSKSPLSTLYQIDFSQQLILAEQLLRDILRPRVYLVQDNNSLLFQNLSIRHNFAFFNLYKHSFQEVADIVRTGSYRDVLICNYRQQQQDLICKDFYWIEKNIGPIRYLAVWGPESAESHDETLQLERPPAPEKPKLAEGEEEAPPPPEEEGEAKKKVFNIYDHSWTKPGNQKNLSQWFFKQKRSPAVHEHTQTDLSSKGLGFVLEHLTGGRDHHVYHRITG